MLSKLIRATTRRRMVHFRGGGRVIHRSVGRGPRWLSSGVHDIHSNWQESDFKIPERTVHDVLSPTLVISLPNVRHNIAEMINLCSGNVDRWRPHVKTTKMPLVWRLMMESGVRNFKCATIREARILAEVAEDEGLLADVDILVAFPLHGANLRALGDLATKLSSCKFSCLIEDSSDVGSVPSNVGYFLDINPGMDRTGRPLSELASKVDDLAHIVSEHGSSRFLGLHFYDGHSGTTHCGNERQDFLFPLYDELLDFVKQLQESGVTIPEIITSGTPSCTTALKYEGFKEAAFVHRVSPGTTVFHDYKTHEENDDLASILRPAAAVLARVVSHPSPGSLHVIAGSAGSF